jgi:hypothetical protein
MKFIAFHLYLLRVSKRLILDIINDYIPALNAKVFADREPSIVQKAITRQAEPRSADRSRAPSL